MFNQKLPLETLTELVKEFGLSPTRNNLFRAQLCWNKHRLKHTIYALHVSYDLKILRQSEVLEPALEPPPLSIMDLDLPYYSPMLRRLQDPYFIEPIYLYNVNKTNPSSELDIKHLTLRYKATLYQQKVGQHDAVITDNGFEWYHDKGWVLSVTIYKEIEAFTRLLSGSTF